MGGPGGGGRGGGMRGPGGGMRGPGGGMRGPGGFGGMFRPLGMWLRPLWGLRPLGCGCLTPILGVVAILGLALMGLLGPVF